MWFGVNETMVGTHSGWKVPASIDLSLASAVTFNWSESRYAALVRKGPLWVPTVEVLHSSIMALARFLRCYYLI